MGRKKALEEMQKIDDVLKLIALNIQCARFKWDNLPSNLTPKKLETMLFERGSLVGFSFGENYAILPYTSQGALNIYGDLISIKPISYNGVIMPNLYVHDLFDTKGMNIIKQNAVMLRNNRLNISTWKLIEPIINRLTYIWHSLGINECISRARAIITAEKNISKKLMEQLYGLFNSALPFAVVNNNGLYTNNEEGLQLFNFDVNYQPQDYWLDFDNTFNLFLTTLGINNYSNDKRERLISDEVNANNELIDIMKNSMYEERLDFCKEFNKMFGTNIDVVDLYEEKNNQENEKELDIIEKNNQENKEKTIDKE